MNGLKILAPILLKGAGARTRLTQHLRANDIESHKRVLIIAHVQGVNHTVWRFQGWKELWKTVKSGELNGNSFSVLAIMLERRR